MEVGGNKALKDFFAAHDDVKPGMSMQEKYNTRSAGNHSRIDGAWLWVDRLRSCLAGARHLIFACAPNPHIALALFRDKVACEAAGKPWSEATSSAQSWVPPSTAGSSRSRSALVPCQLNLLLFVSFTSVT